MTTPTNIERIRREVFRVSQKEMAAILQVSQGTLSKWERKEGEPGLTELGRVRDEARERKLPWDDSWFFDGPPPVEGATSSADAAA